MPTVAISPFFNSHHHDNNGNPASGWLVYTYYSRTTQKKDTYKDPQGISKHENPITLDARGEYPGGGLFLIAGETYSIVLKDPNSETELTWHSVIGGTEGIAPEKLGDLSDVIDTESLIGAEITKNASGVYQAFWPIVNEDDANSAISPNANVWINNATLTEDRTFALPTPFKGKSLEISNRGSSELFDVIIIPTYPNTLQYGIPSLSLKGGNASGLKGLILRGMSDTTWAIVSTCNL